MDLLAHWLLHREMRGRNHAGARYENTPVAHAELMVENTAQAQVVETSAHAEVVEMSVMGAEIAPDAH